MIFVPISTGYEKCPNCGKILNGYSPILGNTVGSPFLFCKRCKIECISTQRREWLHFSPLNKTLYLCNIIFFSTIYGLCSGAFGVFIVGKLGFDISFSIFIAACISITIIYMFVPIFIIIRSLWRMDDADYIFRLHQSNVHRIEKVSLVGILCLSIIALTMMILIAVWLYFLRI